MVELNHPEVKKLAREIVFYTGETMTQAVVNALRERLLREQKKYRPQPPSLQEELLRIGQECAALPILDQRTPDEILGYNETLLFKGNDFSQTDILLVKV
jgi:antitoxin VapB